MQNGISGQVILLYFAISLDHFNACESRKTRKRPQDQKRLSSFFAKPKKQIHKLMMILMLIYRTSVRRRRGYSGCGGKKTLVVKLS